MAVAGRSSSSRRRSGSSASRRRRCSSRSPTSSSCTPPSKSAVSSDPPHPSIDDFQFNVVQLPFTKNRFFCSSRKLTKSQKIATVKLSHAVLLIDDCCSFRYASYAFLMFWTRTCYLVGATLQIRNCCLIESGARKK